MNMEFCWFEMMWYATVSNCVSYYFMCHHMLLCDTIFFAFRFGFTRLSSTQMFVYLKIIRLQLFLSTWSNNFEIQNEWRPKIIKQWSEKKRERARNNLLKQETFTISKYILFAFKAIKLDYWTFREKLQNGK